MIFINIRNIPEINFFMNYQSIYISKKSQNVALACFNDFIN